MAGEKPNPLDAAADIISGRNFETAIDLLLEDPQQNAFTIVNILMESGFSQSVKKDMIGGLLTRMAEKMQDKSTQGDAALSQG